MFSRLIPRLVAFSLLLSGMQTAVLAEPCQPEAYSVCFNDTCVCISSFSSDVADMAAQAVRALEQARIPVLEAWLLASRNDAFLASQPVPAAIQQQLAGYISEDVLQRARFKVGESNSLNLGSLALAYGGFESGETVVAITLVDVVIFRTAADASNNPGLWAHELAHVQQFLDWGVRDFAARYVNDAATVEAQADQVQQAFEQRRN